MEKGSFDYINSMGYKPLVERAKELGVKYVGLSTESLRQVIIEKLEKSEKHKPKSLEELNVTNVGEKTPPSVKVKKIDVEGSVKKVEETFAKPESPFNVGDKVKAISRGVEKTGIIVRIYPEGDKVYHKVKDLEGNYKYFYKQAKGLTLCD